MFISARFVKENGLATRKKPDGGYELITIDGKLLPSVNSETVPLYLAFQEHYEEIVLDVMPIARHNITLGTP